MRKIPYVTMWQIECDKPTELMFIDNVNNQIHLKMHQNKSCRTHVISKLMFNNLIAIGDLQNFKYRGDDMTILELWKITDAPGVYDCQLNKVSHG